MDVFKLNEGFNDITGAEIVDIQVRHDGKVVWVNVNGVCVLRVCKINGPVKVEDMRPNRELDYE